MTEFEKALQECLYDLEQGDSNVDECLRRYPTYAQQLEPILLTSAYLQRGHEARPSDAFKARVRSKLVQQMYVHPRQPARSNFMFMRLAVGLAAVFLALLATGTVYAQGALPGNAFYAWKLASENAWRMVSSDPVGIDVAIAERRVYELIAVRDEPTLYSQALEAYLEVTERLKSEMDTQNKAQILTVLDAQVEELNQSGIVLPQIDQGVIPPSDEPTLTPLPTSTVTPLPILGTPSVNPTDLPQIVPTIQVPREPDIIPTIKAPPKIIPTIEILPPIP